MDDRKPGRTEALSEFGNVGNHVALSNVPCLIVADISECLHRHCLLALRDDECTFLAPIKSSHYHPIPLSFPDPPPGSIGHDDWQGWYRDPSNANRAKPRCSSRPTWAGLSWFRRIPGLCA